MTADAFRRIVLRLPDTVESAHMGHPDFRTAGKIFATLGSPGPGWAMVKLEPAEQHAIVAAHPDTFVPAAGAWGRSGSTNVRLAGADAAAVAHALANAHQATTERAKTKPARRTKR